MFRPLQKKTMFAVAAAAVAISIAAPAQNNSGTITVGGVVYNVSLTAQMPVAVPVTTLPVTTTPVTTPVVTTPVVTDPVTTAPVSTATPTLPDVLMSSAWPLNQPATLYPDETRSLKTGAAYTPAPIVDTFLSTFGANYVKFDTSMPYTVVNTRQHPELMATVTITNDWGNGPSNTFTVVVPAKGCKIELGSDKHCLVADVGTGLLSELYNTQIDANGNYSASAEKDWNMNAPQVGAPGDNSADAAGLPILPLLARYAELSAGPAKHALRGTMNLTRDNGNGGAFVPPASHAAGNNWGSPVPEGMRLRLRSDFPTTGLSGIALNIVTTLQSYGQVIADNGTSGMLTCDDDPRWANVMDSLNRMGMKLSDFIPVNSGPIIDASGYPVQ